MNPVISIVLGSYNRRRYLEATLESIRRHDISVPYETIVVDGGSTDGSLAFLARQKDVITIVQHNRGMWRGRPVPRRSWGYFMNLGFKTAQGKYVCMISDDCLLVPGAVMNGYRLFESKLEAGERVGAMAFYFSYRPGRDCYYVGRVYGRLLVNHGLYLKEAIEAVGYADEEGFMFYNADADLCLRMDEQGFACVDSPDSYVEHHSHANPGVRSTNMSLMAEDNQRFIERWRRLDPSLDNFNDVLSGQHRDFSDPARTADVFKRIDRWHRHTQVTNVRRWSHDMRGRLQIRTRIKRLLGLGKQHERPPRDD